jgi:hypothetical protein
MAGSGITKGRKKNAVTNSRLYKKKQENTVNPFAEDWHYGHVLLDLYPS